MNRSIRDFSVAQVGFKANEGLASWALLNYLEETCLHHRKLVTILRICDLYANGAQDHNFSVAADSAPRYPSSRLSEVKFKKVVQLTQKQHSADEFWRKIYDCRRPVVFYQEGSHRIALSEFSDDDAARVINYSEHCPPEGIIRGAIGGLIDLFYAPERESRRREEHQWKREEHELKKLRLGAKIAREVALTQQILSNPLTPPLVTMNANKVYNNVISKHEGLNLLMGIYELSVTDSDE